MIDSIPSATDPSFSIPLFDRWFAGLPAWAESLAGLAILIAVAALANFIFKSILLRMALRVLPHDTPALGRAVARLTNIVPAMVVSRGIAAVPHLPPSLVTVVQNVAGAFVILTIVLALSHALTFVNDLYQRRPHAVNRPIKGYIQVLKIVLFAAAAILMIAQLMDKSPLLLLSGLGAMAAVVMLVFKDTILSLVASVQLTSNDMLRVGDWIEMPQLNADGDVIDIALHTVKVQNWDKTITTIPTHRLIEESFKNWRGMSESGGRRIKRSLMIDQTSVRFLSDQEEQSLRRFALLGDYLVEKQAELERWNSRIAHDGLDPVNSRRVTNFGTFRAYMAAYLRANARISKEMTLLVRQLDPTPQGIPLEIYCFTTTTAWAAYEAIQADIFDHMLAVLDSFDLRVFQEPSGRDLRQLKAA
ncbi:MULTISPECIES: mechanosensitive ion channel family protein [unclassified Sphingobium]|uniref:mechanosensitive ion channel family protein n=1 Tax=unclassified Sphingobium TaxID=2611147 RepID=UPI002224A717|nr:MULTISPECIES: mechanosensitive ion channel family protein [unclassified Sphingobium]MCW2410369.1 miniconductance mechanosensitive channel [Sphingobium sp. B8D3D]MCW2413939.1 miniconductance mechanosensitive channel [Sphingobium sp. B8D3A]